MKPIKGDKNMKLFILGGRGGTNVGESFYRAALSLNIQSKYFDVSAAFEGNQIIRYLARRLSDGKPMKLQEFSQNLVIQSRKNTPEFIITTGLAPVNEQALKEIGKMNVKRINYLTDDPWNKAHYARWFRKALPQYDMVYTTRTSNIDDIRKAGCRRVEYLPFGYDPYLFKPQILTEKKKKVFDADVLFAGGADKDRVPYIHALISAGIKVELYGSYWEKYKETKNSTKGQADIETLREAISGAKIALCLV